MAKQPFKPAKRPLAIQTLRLSKGSRLLNVMETSGNCANREGLRSRSRRSIDIEAITRSRLRPAGGPFGFTLIELLIAIVVLAVLLGIAVPSFTNLIVGNRLATQTNELISAINLARSEAVKRNRTVNFCRTSSATATTCAGAGTWDHWIVLAGVNNVVRRGSLNRFGDTLGVTSDLPGSNLIITPDGLSWRTDGLTANDRKITVCASNGPAQNVRQIVLGASSRISTNALSGTCTW